MSSYYALSSWKLSSEQYKSGYHRGLIFPSLDLIHAADAYL